MLVDGHDVEVVRETLSKDISMTTQRHEFGASIFKSLGDIAPAMAVALLTTLYGAFLANIICLPISAKLNVRSQEEKVNQSLVLDGILGIADGQNPRVIDGILKSYLAESKRANEAKEAEE